MRSLVRRLVPSVVILVLGSIHAGCSSEEDSLVVTGSSTVAPVIGDLAERYEAETGRRVNVQSGGSSRGIQDVSRGLADIGMVSRELFSEERQRGLRAHSLAVDAVVLVVHRDNPVRELASGEVVGLFDGEMDNWTELSGQDRKVVAVNKADGRATLEVFVNHFDLASDEIDASVVAGENQQVIRTVAGNRGAVGYVSVGAALEAIEQGVSIRMPALDGIQPDRESLERGRWPMRRPLNLVLWEKSSAARNFLDYTASDVAMEIIRDHHFHP